MDPGKEEDVYSSQEQVGTTGYIDFLDRLSCVDAHGRRYFFADINLIDPDQ